MVPLHPQELYVTNWEAYKALRDIKTKKAAGPEGIHSVVHKLFAFELVPVVACLYNSTLREGFIPPQLKSAIVHPLPNVTLPKCIEDDVRQISLTYQLAKVLEGFILARVYPSFVGNLDRNHFVVAGKSTEQALVYTRLALEALDRGGCYLRLFFADLNKKKRFSPFLSPYINREAFYTVKSPLELA